MPENPSYRNEAARSRYDVAGLLATMGKKADAEAAYRDALERQQKLANDQPARPEVQMQLATLASGLAIFLEVSESPAAYPSCRRQRHGSGPATSRIGAGDGPTIQLAGSGTWCLSAHQAGRLAGEHL